MHRFSVTWRLGIETCKWHNSVQGALVVCDKFQNNKNYSQKNQLNQKYVCICPIGPIIIDSIIIYR